MLKVASEILNVKETELNLFEDTFDPYNDVCLSGVLCRHSDHKYGCLVLFKIDDMKLEVPQIIWATPKLEYPFDRSGNFNWPKVNEIEVWDKLDGTNILAYHYGNGFITYKTRLGTILRDGNYGKFYSMWNELLEEHQWIKQVILDNPDYNLSFELYGLRNPITVKYNIALDVKLLFGIRQTDGAIKPPSQLNIDIEYIPDKFNFQTSDSLTELYNSLRIDMSNDNEEDLYREGCVLYAHVGEPSWKMFKCKPSEIEQIHWSAGGVIPRQILWNTAINVFEDRDDPTENDFIELLKEEFTIRMINQSRQRITNIFNNVKKHMEMVARINNIWNIAKRKGFDIAKDKDATLRFISQYFDKREMRKVGAIILKQANKIS